jgi:hypothetical protein
MTISDSSSPAPTGAGVRGVHHSGGSSSRLAVLPVTEAITWRAIELLCEAGRHGHNYAIDAVVAGTAPAHAGPRIILTSDQDDMAKLCGTKVHLKAV